MKRTYEKPTLIRRDALKPANASCVIISGYQVCDGGNGNNNGGGGDPT